MLREWYHPGRKSVWTEDVAFCKLNSLKLILEQQSAVDRRIKLAQWALGRDQQYKPVNDLSCQLIASMAVYRQASTLLLNNADQIMAYRFNMTNFCPELLMEPSCCQKRGTFSIWPLNQSCLGI